jgi:glycosyltransferase involved in cell wall biosynthesis
MEHSSKIIHISEKSKYLLKSNPVLHKKSLVVPSCSQNIFAARKKKNMKNKRLTFTYWGAIGKRIKLDIVIQGFAKAKILNTKFDAQLFLIGSGDDLNRLKKLVQELNTSNIFFKDYMNQKELCKFLQESSVAVIAIYARAFLEFFVFSDLYKFRANCKKVKHLFMPETVFKELGEEIGGIING